MAKTQAVQRVSSKSANPTKTSATKSAARKTAVASGQKATPATKHAKSKAAARKSASKTAPRKSTKSLASKAPAKLGKSSTAGKYSDPELRERIKAKVMREDKGGRAGQWSARKAQIVANEYEAAGGTYKGARDEQQKSLTEWTDEHWTTEDGKPARRKDGMHRYLPEKAWEQLSPAEKRSTEKKKLAGDYQGKQFVANTQAAVKARRSAEK